MSAFARLLGAPANILRDCIKIMKLELVSSLFVVLQNLRSEQLVGSRTLVEQIAVEWAKLIIAKLVQK